MFDMVGMTMPSSSTPTHIPEWIVHVLCNSTSCTGPRLSESTSGVRNLHTHPINVADPTLDNVSGPYHIIICDREFTTCPLLATPIPNAVIHPPHSSSSRSHDQKRSRYEHPRRRDRHVHYIPTTYMTARATHRAWQEFHESTIFLDLFVSEVARLCAVQMSRQWAQQMSATTSYHPHARRTWRRFSVRRWRVARKMELMTCYRRDLSMLMAPAWWMSWWCHFMGAQLAACTDHAAELRHMASRWRMATNTPRFSSSVPNEVDRGLQEHRGRGVMREKPEALRQGEDV